MFLSSHSTDPLLPLAWCLHNKNKTMKIIAKRAKADRPGNRSNEELALIAEITTIRSLPNHDTANKNITCLRRAFRLLHNTAAEGSDKHASIHDFAFLENTAACIAAVESVHVTTRRQILSALGNACQALAEREAKGSEKQLHLITCAEVYRKAMTALNEVIAKSILPCASAKDEAMFVSQERIREWEMRVHEHADSVRKSAFSSAKLAAEDFHALSLSVLITLGAGVTLNPVRGAELSKLWTAATREQAETFECFDKCNWAIRDSRVIVFNSHKAKKKHGTIEFEATKPWQVRAWTVLNDFIPFLALQLGKEEHEPMPLFVNAFRENEQYNAKQINELLRVSSQEIVGRGLGSRALRKLYASAHASILPTSDADGLIERAKQSLHTTNVEALFYAKQFMATTTVSVA